MHLNLFQPKLDIGSKLLEISGSSHHDIHIFYHFDKISYQTWGTLVDTPFPFSMARLSYYHRNGSPISLIMTWILRPHTSLPYSSHKFMMGFLFRVSLHKHVLKYLHEHFCLLLQSLSLMLCIFLCSHFLLYNTYKPLLLFSWHIHVRTIWFR